MPSVMMTMWSTLLIDSTSFARARASARCKFEFCKELNPVYGMLRSSTAASSLEVVSSNSKTILGEVPTCMAAMCSLPALIATLWLSTIVLTNPNDCWKVLVWPLDEDESIINISRASLGHSSTWIWVDTPSVVLGAMVGLTVTVVVVAVVLVRVVSVVVTVAVVVVVAVRVAVDEAVDEAVNGCLVGAPHSKLISIIRDSADATALHCGIVLVPTAMASPCMTTKTSAFLPVP